MTMLQAKDAVAEYDIALMKADVAHKLYKKSGLGVNSEENEMYMMLQRKYKKSKQELFNTKAKAEELYNRQNQLF